jgi:hypothetical protein
MRMMAVHRLVLRPYLTATRCNRCLLQFKRSCTSLHSSLCRRIPSFISFSRLSLSRPAGIGKGMVPDWAEGFPMLEGPAGPATTFGLLNNIDGRSGVTRQKGGS